MEFVPHLPACLVMPLAERVKGQETGAEPLRFYTQSPSLLWLNMAGWTGESTLRTMPGDRLQLLTWDLEVVPISSLPRVRSK